MSTGVITGLTLCVHRLVSGYYQKFIKLAKHGTWAPKIKMIIERYRDRPNTGDQVHPTPEEFIRYILDRLRANRRQTDPHWRPQHLQVDAST